MLSRLELIILVFILIQKKNLVEVMFILVQYKRTRF